MASTVTHREVWDSRQQTIRFPGLFESDGDDSDERTLSLRGAYEKFLLPHLRRKSNAHRTKFSTVLDHWERLMDPLTVGQMDGNDIALIDFQDKLIRQREQGKKIGPRTANGYISQYLGAILRVCGRRDNRNKKGRNIIRDVPFVDPLEFVPKRPINATLTQLGRLYEAASIATWPDCRTLPAPLFLRVLFALSFTYGIRTEDLAPIKCTDGGLTWDSVRWNSRCPVEEIELDYPLGWIVFVPGKTKHNKAELVLPQTAVVKRHLEALPRPWRPGAFLLPFPTYYEAFLEQRKAIEKEAGIEQSITLQMMRRSCQSYWDLTGIRDKKTDILGDYITGHSDRGVSAKFYREPLLLLVDPDDRGERLIDRFRYPDSFLKGP